MKKSKINIFLNILLIISTLCLSVGYASINSISMTLNGTVEFTVSNKLFISDVTVYQTSNAIGSVNYYNGTLLDTTVELSSNSTDNSFVTFAVTLYNNADYNYLYSSSKFLSIPGSPGSQN